MERVRRLVGSAPGDVWARLSDLTDAAEPVTAVLAELVEEVADAHALAGVRDVEAVLKRCMSRCPLLPLS
jgi:hypothetical protein